MEKLYIDSIDEAISVFESIKSLPTIYMINEIVKTIKSTIDLGHKVMIAGNGGSAAHAQHFASELTGKFDNPRVPLPALALTTDTSAITAIANDYGYDHTFSRQLIALGRDMDCFVALSTSGKSQNILNALSVCLDNDISSVLITSTKAPESIFAVADQVLLVNSENVARIQEAHHLILHMICERIDDIYS